ncbi:MAG: hypothetical protein Q7T55_00735, partial [Solirubrobacteraceae bacterium]|nr:hypothetical protein [Solirubrobacteraceae bacterium]
VAGSRAVVTGTANPVGRATRVHSSQTIGDDTFVTDGTRTRLRAKVTVTYRGKSAPLTCGQAYAFDTTTVRA